MCGCNSLVNVKAYYLCFKLCFWSLPTHRFNILLFRCFIISSHLHLGVFLILLFKKCALPLSPFYEKSFPFSPFYESNPSYSPSYNAFKEWLSANSPVVLLSLRGVSKDSGKLIGEPNARNIDS